MPKLQEAFVFQCRMHGYDALRIHILQRTRFGCEGNAPNTLDLFDVLGAQLTNFRDPRARVGADPNPDNPFRILNADIR
jgi:hypothetical protein